MIFRKPTFSDIEFIYDIVNNYANKGVMLPRSRNTLYETIRDMIVAEENGAIIGVGGLHVVWDELAEIRTMAVKPEYVNKGIGREIVRLLIDEGKKIGVKQFFALTYKTNFFYNNGFRKISKDDLPHKVWKECIECPKFPNCDEVAMIMRV